jgi:hypothetical protein
MATMSRSHQKSWVHKWACARSERFYKRLRASRERLAARLALHHGEWEKAEVEQVRWNEFVTGRDGYVTFWSEQRARRFAERWHSGEGVDKWLHRLFGK